MAITSKITRRNLDEFLKKHATNEKILDIGCGGASDYRFFPNRIAVDIDPARKPDVVGDAHNLPFDDCEFDAVLSTDVMEHLNDPVKAVSEMYRVLKPGGKVIFCTRFIFPIHDSPNDYWRFTKYGLRELFKDFEITEFDADTVNFGTIAILLQRIGYQTKFKFNKISKFIIFTFAKIISGLNSLIKEEYGDIARKNREEGILASGYYLIAK